MGSDLPLVDCVIRFKRRHYYPEQEIVLWEMIMLLKTNISFILLVPIFVLGVMNVRLFVNRLLKHEQS